MIEKSSVEPTTNQTAIKRNRYKSTSVTCVIAALTMVLTTGCGGGTPEITYSDEPLAEVKLNDKWGFIDTKGNEVIPCKYEEVEEFSEGLAAVKLEDRWMYIDKTGKIIIKLDKKTDIANEFSEGLAHIRGYKPFREGFIDKTGKIIISLLDKDGRSKYHWARAFHNGRAAVTTDIVHEKQWGFIDTTGIEIIPCQFKEVKDFSDRRAFVNGQREYRDQFGNRFSGSDKKILDIDGNVVGSWNEYTGEFSPEGWALHKSFTLTARIDQVYFVNSSNSILKTGYSNFADANPFSEGLASVKVFNKEAEGRREWQWGFVDKNGKTVIPPIYYDAGEFREGLAAVQEVEIYQEREYADYYGTYTRGGKWGFIDKTGKVVIPFRYATVTEKSSPGVVGFEHYSTNYSYFSDGLALVRAIETYKKTVREFDYNKEVYYDSEKTMTRGGKFGFIDKSGKEVIPCKYNSAQVFTDGFSKISINDKYGYIDKTGREIVPCDYESKNLRKFANGLCAVCRSGKWGYVDTEGKEVIPCKYDFVYDFKK